MRDSLYYFCILYTLYIWVVLHFVFRPKLYLHIMSILRWYFIRYTTPEVVQNLWFVIFFKKFSSCTMIVMIFNFFMDLIHAPAYYYYYFYTIYGWIALHFVFRPKIYQYILNYIWNQLKLAFFKYTEPKYVASLRIVIFSKKWFFRFIEAWMRASRKYRHMTRHFRRSKNKRK